MAGSRLLHDRSKTWMGKKKLWKDLVVVVQAPFSLSDSGYQNQASFFALVVDGHGSVTCAQQGSSHPFTTVWTPGMGKQRGKVRSCRGSFQFSSAVSSSLFLRETVTFKTSPFFQLRADERMGQSQSTSYLFPAHYWASDRLVLLAQP